MGADAIAKRYFPAILCALLALVAFFQARGVSALVAGQLPAPLPASSAATHGPAALRMPQGKSVSAQAILARNAFDFSITGPLDKIAPPTPIAPPPTNTGPQGGEDPPCTTAASIVLIADSEDPAWSFALIRTSAGSKMRRIGDDIDGQVINNIAWDRVWLATGTSRCQMKLDIAANKGPEAATPGRPAGKPIPAGKPEAEGASGDVTKTGENEYVVSRAAVEKAQGFANELRKGTKLVPGKGIRLSRVEPGSLLGQVGINSGDIVKTINGFDMTDLDKASEGYSRLKTATDVTLGMERNGQPVTVTVRIK